MSHKYGQSPQWAHINENNLALDEIPDLSRFKSSRVNYKLALWNPEVNGRRYLKTLIHNLGLQLSPENWERMLRIRNRQLGEPVAVTLKGESICLDYLQAVLELDFMARSVKMDGARILEIGAGYGRSCHAILSNHDVAEYHIIDLENCLRLSREYLRAVLTGEQFEKIRFLGIDEVEDLYGGEPFDLCVNIDSFAEMPADTVENYLSLIDGIATHLYTKNPVGKYLDPDLDGHYEGQAVVQQALASGLLREIIDVHDSAAVQAQSERFLEVYQPGDDWRLVADGWGTPWSYYWQALYAKS